MDMLDEVLRIMALYHGDNNFYMNKHVPNEIEHNARATLEIPDDDYILGALRVSFKKFHRGIIISQQGIYWLNGSNVPTSVNRMSWRELSERKAGFKAKIKAVTLGDGAVIDCIGSMYKPKAVINLLDVLIERFESQQVEGNDGFVFEGSDIDGLARSIPLDKERLREQNLKEINESFNPFEVISDLFKKMLGK